VLARALTRIKVPVAAIYGEHDPLYAGCLAELQLLMQRQCGGAGLAGDAGVGHWVQHEDPATFCAALQEALS
jgi:pimeloyl-ACP methyl ester carboxylesterase